MKVLHVTPHLGGGVGKAHAAICDVTQFDVERTYALLEPPRDTRYAARIAASGARLVEVRDAREVARLAEGADIVQFEFWNHPRMYELLAATTLPPMRAVFWCHISGLRSPLVPVALVERAHRFVFTTACSLDAANLRTLSSAARARAQVIGGAFGFEAAPGAAGRPPKHQGTIAYLGTVDFAKLHPEVFDIIDAVTRLDRPVDMWGAFEPDGAPAAAARRMRNPDRVRLLGHTVDARAVLSPVDIFLYPLASSHYGTGENALIEAMSLGAVPVVIANPVERSIVTHGVTGLLAATAAECAAHVDVLLGNPRYAEQLGARAAQETAVTRVPTHAAGRFSRLYEELLSEDRREVEFASAIGRTPIEWYLSSQETVAPGDVIDLAALTSPHAAKGTLTHFRAAFPDDDALRRLHAAQGIASTRGTATAGAAT